MKIAGLLTLSFLINAVIGPAIFSDDITADQICRKTFARTKEIKTLRYQMNKQERIGDEIFQQISMIKLNRSPYQVYMKQLSPKKGLEVLFKEDQNPDKAYVNTNGFPWITLKMDPKGHNMLKNQHHTVKDAGFDLVVSLLEHLLDKYASDLDDMLELGPDTYHQQNNCYQIVFKNHQFKFIKYTVSDADDVMSIAKEKNISSYLIMEKNNLDHYDDIEEGDTIMIPNDYSPRIELLIDKSRFIPISIKVFDEQGIFEHYQYSDVEINPPFTSEDFSRENPDYGF